jgi:hypothetical protein
VIGSVFEMHNNRISEIALLCRKWVSITVRVVTSERQPSRLVATAAEDRLKHPAH